MATRKLPWINLAAIAAAALAVTRRGGDRSAGEALRDATAGGLAVLLAGVRADLLSAIERVGIGLYLPTEPVFAEEDDEFSATLPAVRKAFALRASETDAGSAATHHHGTGWWCLLSGVTLRASADAPTA